MTYPSYPSPKRGPLFPILITTVVVLVVALVVAVVLIVMNDGQPDDSATPAAATSTEAAGATQTAPAATATATAQPEPQAPVAGAYVGAGGPRPAGAEPLPTYTSRYTKLESAHLLTPTGGIGCDFNAADQDGKQGQCGVRKFAQSSPFGCESIGGSCKQKWLFQLVGDRVGAPVGSTGTTGWMNQPANDGYTVPRVEYGRTYYFQDWVIASAFNGLTVWNATTGSGVFLSNERAQTFDGPGRAGPATTGTTTAPTTATAEPIVLGAPQSNGRGYGAEQPSEIHLGGASSTSEMKNIAWTDWGSDRATGTGIGNYQPPNKTGIYRESGVPGTVVAFAPGDCGGKRAYTKIVYFFPSKGEQFDPGNAIDICTPR